MWDYVYSGICDKLIEETTEHIYRIYVLSFVSYQMKTKYAIQSRSNGLFHELLHEIGQSWACLAIQISKYWHD